MAMFHQQGNAPADATDAAVLDFGEVKIEEGKTRSS